MKSLELSRGKVAIVDDETYIWLKKYKWTLSGSGKYALYYPKRNGKRRLIQMHRIIMNAKKREIVDHIDGNGLNNQKENLRIVTHRQNMLNKKNLKKKIGITRHQKGYWARIRVEKKHISLGVYENEDDAIRAYEDAARKYYGDKAFLS
ncbi:MAG: HNH endonuclease [Clostridia bacterium]|nr:HNH endonuclease [Clostridia bacterium]